MPTLCTFANQGSCECANLKTDGSDWEGTQTYTFWVKGKQRCFTTYTPPSAAEPMPVLLHLNCYAKDRLSGLGIGEGTSSDVITNVADRCGVAMGFLSTPDGKWHLGGDFAVNDSTPMRCTGDDMEDISYAVKITSWFGAQGSTYDKIYTEGFSQNSADSMMFGVCMRDAIAGSWEGASGSAAGGCSRREAEAKESKDPKSAEEPKGPKEGRKA